MPALRSEKEIQHDNRRAGQPRITSAQDQPLFIDGKDRLGGSAISLDDEDGRSSWAWIGNAALSAPT